MTLLCAVNGFGNLTRDAWIDGRAVDEEALHGRGWESRLTDGVEDTLDVRRVGKDGYDGILVHKKEAKVSHEVLVSNHQGNVEKKHLVKTKVR